MQVKFDSSDAWTIIKTALESGVIRLQGSAGNIENAKRNAELDTAYLLTLLKGLQEPTK